MENLKTLEYSLLVDMLAEETMKLTKGLIEGSSEEEYARIKLNISAIQFEIDSRKQTSSNTDSTDPTIIFPAE